MKLHHATRILHSAIYCPLWQSCPLTVSGIGIWYCMVAYFCASKNIECRPLDQYNCVSIESELD